MLRPVQSKRNLVNNHEAKEALSLYRPGISDPNDSEFAEALAFVRNEPDLDQWFQEHCAFQKAVRNSFRQVPVPEGLKEQIISERPIEPASPRKRNRVLAVAAVCILLLLLVAGINLRFSRSREDTSYANFRSRMVKIAARAYPKMDLESSDPKEIRSTLAQKGGPADYVLPEQLEKTHLTGCAVLTWQGKPVSMICFKSGRAGQSNDPDLFLFVINRRDAPNAPMTKKPVFREYSGYNTASWSSTDKTYLLATDADTASLQSYF
jgi:hypothetical protein